MQMLLQGITWFFTFGLMCSSIYHICITPHSVRCLILCRLISRLFPFLPFCFFCYVRMFQPGTPHGHQCLLFQQRGLRIRYFVGALVYVCGRSYRGQAQDRQDQVWFFFYLSALPCPGVSIIYDAALSLPFLPISSDGRRRWKSGHTNSLQINTDADEAG